VLTGIGGLYNDMGVSSCEYRQRSSERDTIITVILLAVATQGINSIFYWIPARNSTFTLYILCMGHLKELSGALALINPLLCIFVLPKKCITLSLDQREYILIQRDY